MIDLNETNDIDSPLETPGSIAVIGGGIVGVEAALYGRYLGYRVSLFEAGRIGASSIDAGDEPLPMLPDRSFSPLAASAIAAQSLDRPAALPVTRAGWAEQILLPLTRVDLLRGNVHAETPVASIGLVPVDIEDGESPENDTENDAEEVPPDFELRFGGDRPAESFEAVLVAIDDAKTLSAIGLEFETPAAYFFPVQRGETGNAEADFALALQRIVAVYSNLADRGDLDLYAPRRG